MKTTGNFWFPTRGQTQTAEDTQPAPHKQPAAEESVDYYDAFSPSSSLTALKEGVTISGMFFAPDDIRALLYFVKAKAPTQD